MLALGSSLSALLSLTCDKSPTGPEPLKDPRTYTWTIDTLAYPGSFQTAMRDIWGSSPNDVYVIGHNFLNYGLMWHFDGLRWTDVKLSTMQGGAIAGAIDLSAIYGFAANDIWAVGEHIFSNPNPPPNLLDSSLIIHYDGVQWREQIVRPRRALWSISGSSPTDLWACGTDGTLYHYDRTEWEEDSVSVWVPQDGVFALWDIKAKSSSEVYMIGYVHQNSLGLTKQYFLMRQRNSWIIVDSSIAEPGHLDIRFGTNGLWVSPEGTLYSFGPHIFRWTGSSWTKIYETMDALRRLGGTSDENIFAVGDFGKVLHYNGTDWFQLRQFEDLKVVYTAVWTNGDEVMIVGFTVDYPQKTLILHGK